MNLGYAPLSAIDRLISPAPHLDRFFPKVKTNGPVKKLMANGDVSETLQQMIDIVKKRSHEVSGALHLVRGKDVYSTAKNIFEFLFKYVKYNTEPGEILNSPAVSWYYGQIKARENQSVSKLHPVDCDDFSIFAASFLQELGYKWAFRIASYNGVNFGHVYCVIPLENNKFIIIDPVYYEFDKEKSYIKQQTVSPNFQRLAGIDIFYQGVNGFAGIEARSKADDIDTYLENTARIIENHPNIVMSGQYSTEYAAMLRQAVGYLETDNLQGLETLAGRESELIHLGVLPYDNDLSWRKDQQFSGIEPETEGLKYKYITDSNGNQERLVFGTLGLIGALFKKRTAAQKAARKEARQERKAERKEKIKVVFSKINKINPLTIAARNGLRVLIALNFRGIASKLAANPEAYEKAKALYVQIGGRAGLFVADVRNGSTRTPLLVASGSHTVDGIMEEAREVNLRKILSLSGGLFKQIESKTIKQTGGTVKKMQVRTVKPIIKKKTTVPSQVAKALLPINSLIILINLNYNRIADDLAANPKAYEDTARMYIANGGNIANFQLAVLNGKGKKAPENINIVELGSLGEVITVSAALTSASAFLVKIFGFLKDKDKADGVKEGVKKAGKISAFFKNLKAKRAARKAAKGEKEEASDEGSESEQDEALDAKSAPETITAQESTDEVMNSTANAVASGGGATNNKAKPQKSKKKTFADNALNFLDKAKDFLNKDTLPFEDQTKKALPDKSTSNTAEKDNNIIAPGEPATSAKNKKYLVAGIGALTVLTGLGVYLYNKKKPPEPPQKLSGIKFS